MSELGVGETVKEEPPGTSSIKQDPTTLHRPPSPDSSCPICLDSVNAPAFIDPCLHQFCFECLYQWSQVKPECPLCKSRFTYIVHNVRSIRDYDLMPVGMPHPVESNFFISVAFQRPRFIYSSSAGNLLGGNNEWRLMNDITTVPRSNTNTAGMSTGMTVASDWRRRRQASAVEFRRLIYRQNQWVQPVRNFRVRETSPTFYRENPAQLHRLVPWLNRELNVLLDVRFDTNEVCMTVLDSIKMYYIKSTRFYRVIWPYLGARSGHFIHEFFNFAISPYDMLAYDLHSEYARVDTMSDQVLESEPDVADDDVVIIEPPSVEPIVISDTEEVVSVDEDRDSDSSVVVIGSRPAICERQPDEVIILDDSDNGNCDNSSSNTARKSSSSLHSSSPVEDHSSQRLSEDTKDEIRLRSTYQRGLVKYYKEDSSSSESDYEPRRRRVKRRKHKEKKRKRVTSSEEDEDELYHPPRYLPDDPTPPRGESSPSPDLPLPRLKSVVRRVNRDGAGCSSWQCSSS